MNLVESFLQQLISLAGTVFVVLIIWFVGMWIWKLIAKLVGKLNLKGTKADDKLRNLILGIVAPLYKFVLVVVILDYVGIGQAIIGAILGSVSMALGIAFGWAFGSALVPEAKAIVKKVKSLLK